MFEKWLKLAVLIVDNVSNKQNLVCPKCGEEKVDYQFVGNETTRIGYLDIWCRSCLNGIHMSRVKVPQNECMITFDMPLEKISERIPNFKQITPKVK